MSYLLNRAAVKREIKLPPGEAAMIRRDANELGLDYEIIADTARRLDPALFKRDAGETLLLTRALLYTLHKELIVQYTPTKARSLFPINHEIPPGAEQYSWNLYDEAGMSKIIDTFADDLPIVAMKKSEIIQSIKSIGHGFEWSLQQIRAAALDGTPLDSRLLKIARDVFERAIEFLAAYGATGANIPGAMKNANVTVVDLTSASFGAWASATNDHIIADLNYMASYVDNATNQAFAIDTLLLPVTLYNLIQARILNSAGSGDTILTLFMRNQQHIKRIEAWAPLATGNSAGNGNRIMGYKNAADTIEMIIPQEFEALPPQAINLHFRVPCHGRVGGVAIYQPIQVVYFDGA